jgi:hypothetical protein
MACKVSWSLTASVLVSMVWALARTSSPGADPNGRRCRRQATGEHDRAPRVGLAAQRPRRRRRLAQPAAAPDQPYRPSRVRPHGHPSGQYRDRPATADRFDQNGTPNSLKHPPLMTSAIKAASGRLQPSHSSREAAACGPRGSARSGWWSCPWVQFVFKTWLECGHPRAARSSRSSISPARRSSCGPPPSTASCLTSKSRTHRPAAHASRISELSHSRPARCW